MTAPLVVERATTGTARPLETGWLADTPIDDTLLRRFVHNQADVNAAIAQARGGRVDRAHGAFLADAASPVPFLNQAILDAPVLRADDPVLDTIDAFFARPGQPATLLSIWPTPDLTTRGWSLMGHPAFVLRAPRPSTYERPSNVDVQLAREPADYETAEQVIVEGYPIDEARGEPPGCLIPQASSSIGLEVRLGLIDGEPVAVGEVLISHGVANLCMGATLPHARRHGVWEALVWARVATSPDLPAVAVTSDLSRPGFVRMGFLPVTRLTLWHRPTATERI